MTTHSTGWLTLYHRGRQTAERHDGDKICDGSMRENLFEERGRPQPEPASLKVAHVIDRLQRPGGAETLMVTLAQAMENMPVELTFLTIKPSDPAMVREIEICGARVRPFVARKLVNPRRMGALCRFMRDNDFDLIHTHLTGATILGAITGIWNGVPVITTIHNTVFQADSHPYHGRLEKLLLRRYVSEVIAVGKETAKVSQARLNGRTVKVIPNAVPDSPTLSGAARQHLRATMGVPPESDGDTILLVWAGRLTKQKGLGDLLTSFADLCRIYDHIRLAIIGDGELAAELRAQSSALGAADRICFAGLRSDVMDLFAAGDIYVSASHWEGFPIAMLEAMSAGLPVVATDVGDTATILSDGAGVVVPPGRPEMLAAELGKVIANETFRYRLAHEAKRRIESQYRAKTWAEAHLALYRLVLGRA